MIIDYLKELFNDDYKIVEHTTTNRFYPIYKGEFIFKKDEEYRLSGSNIGCICRSSKSDAKKLIKELKEKKVL